MSDGGKGSSPRPFSVSNEEYAKRWDAIFGKDPKKEDDAKAEDEAFDYVQRQKALEKMVRINQELGLYDEYDSPNRNTSNF